MLDQVRFFKVTVLPESLQSDAFYYVLQDGVVLSYLTDDEGAEAYEIGAAQVQSDWNVSDNTSPAFIKNKPTIYAFTGTSAQYTKGDGSYGTLPTATPGGSDQQIQFNSEGAFAGSQNLIFDGTNVGIGIPADTVIASLLEITANNLGSSPTFAAGLTLSNNTPSVNYIDGQAVQFSPIFRQRGTSWDSSENISRTLDFYWIVQPQYAGELAGGSYVLYKADNGVSTPVMEVSITGPTNQEIFFPNGSCFFNSINTIYYQFDNGASTNLSSGTNGSAIALMNYGNATAFQIYNYFSSDLQWLELGSQEVAGVYNISSMQEGGGEILPIAIYTGSNVNQLYLATSGNVMIGTNIDAGYLLQLSGTGPQMMFDDSNNIPAYVGVNNGTFEIYNSNGGLSLNANSWQVAFNEGVALNLSYTGLFEVYASLLCLQGPGSYFYPPQMATTDKLAMTPQEGWVVYDKTLHQLSYYNGTTWINV